ILLAGARPPALPGRRVGGEARLTSAVVFAYHDVGVRCLQVLLDAAVDVTLVVTHADDPAERVWFASVAELARLRRVRGAARGHTRGRPGRGRLVRERRRAGAPTRPADAARSRARGARA